MLAAVVLLGLVGAWQLYADVGPLDALVLPAPSEVATALWEDRGLLWSNLLVTAEEVGAGIALSLAAGAACAVAIHFSPTLRRALLPLLVGSQAVPIVIVSPLLVA